MAVPPAKYRGFRVTRGDATGEQLAILVPTDYRVLHIASAADEDTDWNVANPTHPTVYIHSETTPATAYGSIAHDATNLIITSVGGGITLTPVGDVIISDTFGLILGATAQITISDGDGSTDLVPELQILGTAAADGSLVVASFNTTNTRAVSPHIALVKGAAATQVATTAVADDEVIGSIIAYASDSGDFETPVAAIEFVVDDPGGPGADAIGGSIEFYTTADGGTTLTMAGVIDTAQNTTLGNGARSGAVRTLTVNNTANDASSGALIRVSAGGASASGDAILQAIELGSHTISLGVDVSGSNFAMTNGVALGTNDIIRITDATPPVMTFNTTHPTGTFDYVCETCGEHSGEPFTCHGQEAVWHDDVEALVPALAWANQPWDRSNKALRHLEKIGVMDLKQNGNEDVPWVGINIAAAQWYTWSALHQMHNRIKYLEGRLATT